MVPSMEFTLVHVQFLLTTLDQIRSVVLLLFAAVHYRMSLCKFKRLRESKSCFTSYRRYIYAQWSHIYWCCCKRWVNGLKINVPFMATA